MKTIAHMKIRTARAGLRVGMGLARSSQAVKLCPRSFRLTVPVRKRFVVLGLL